MNIDQRQLMFFAGAGILVLILAGAFLFGRPAPEDPLTKINLEIWGVYDDVDAFAPVIESFKTNLDKDSEIVYIKKNAETYEEELIDALAAGNGPDVFMVHNTWIPKHHNKIVPAPGHINATQVEQWFPVAVRQDFAPFGTVYALPLYIDTLVMYYNKDLLEQAGIALPPQTWEELDQATLRLRRLDTRTGAIEQAGVALGGSNESVNRASDILSLLMMQFGSDMVDERFRKTHFTTRSNLATGQEVANPGEAAYSYYTKFANPASRYYTWSDSYSYSVDAFVEERVALMFNYGHQWRIIEEKNPFLRYGIAPIPQLVLTDAVNYPSYWGLAVSKQTPNPTGAWDFILYLTTQARPSEYYLSGSGRAPALRTLIAKHADTEGFEVFNKQALTARSWLQPDNIAVENILSNSVKSVITGRLAPAQAATQAGKQIDALLENTSFQP